MAAMSQLEKYTSDLTAAVKSLVDHYQNAPADFKAATAPPQPLVNPEAPDDVHQAQRTILASTRKLQSLLETPTDFVHRLSRHVSDSSLSFLFVSVTRCC